MWRGFADSYPKKKSKSIESSPVYAIIINIKQPSNADDKICIVADKNRKLVFPLCNAKGPYVSSDKLNPEIWLKILAKAFGTLVHAPHMLPKVHQFIEDELDN